MTMLLEKNGFNRCGTGGASDYVVKSLADSGAVIRMKPPPLCVITIAGYSSSHQPGPHCSEAKHGQANGEHGTGVPRTGIGLSIEVGMAAQRLIPRFQSDGEISGRRRELQTAGCGTDLHNRILPSEGMPC